MVDEYTPIITGNRAKLEVQVSTCGICNQKMLKINPKLGKKLRELFPYYYRDDLAAQLKRANIVFQGGVKDKDDHYICEECDKAGKSTFICALCEEERSSDLKEDSFGDPPESLCKVCYETVPAKVWDKKERELWESHRWDFE